MVEELRRDGGALVAAIVDRLPVDQRTRFPTPGSGAVLDPSWSTSMNGTRMLSHHNGNGRNTGKKPDVVRLGTAENSDGMLLPQLR